MEDFIMIEVKNTKQFNVAGKKARGERPRVRRIEFGRYAVKGSQPLPYIVTFSKIEGKNFFACTCPGGVRNQICYHAAAVLPLHVSEAKRTAAPAPVQDRPKIGSEDFDAWVERVMAEEAELYG
jgi:uncharacterized Zn finger protein